MELPTFREETDRKNSSSISNTATRLAPVVLSDEAKCEITRTEMTEVGEWGNKRKKGNSNSNAVIVSLYA